MSMNKIKLNKFLSLVLQHQPQVAGLVLDENGWTDIDSLIAGSAKAGKSIDRAQQEQVVLESDKQRFIIDGDKIRANQGHSIKVDLALTPVQPPNSLFHGSVEKFMERIMADGLKKMNRHHVHLSPYIATAEESR